MTQFSRLGGTFPISAFTDEGQLLMNCGHPIVEWSFRIDELQEYIQTIERAVDEEPVYAQRAGLERLLICLTCAYKHHQKQHEEAQTTAPTSADLEEYLMFYAASVKNTTF